MKKTIEDKIKKEYFEVIALSREDLLNDLTEKQANSLTDQQMERMARKIGDIMMEGGDYWETISEYCDNLKSEGIINK